MTAPWHLAASMALLALLPPLWSGEGAGQEALSRSSEGLAGWLARMRPHLVDVRSTSELEIDGKRATLVCPACASRLRAYYDTTFPGAGATDGGMGFDGAALRHLEVKKNQPILVFCLIGQRSRHAADELRRRGFRRVYTLELGLKNLASAASSDSALLGVLDERNWTGPMD